jgi:hypothetical protein
MTGARPAARRSLAFRVHKLLLLAHSLTSRKAALRLVSAPASLSTERMFRDGR